MRRVFPLLLLLAGCPDDGDNSNNDDCDSCGDDEFCLVHAQGDFDNWTESCEATPEACDQPATCDCAADLYDLCPDPDNVISWACSDTFPPAIVTCGYE